MKKPIMSEVVFLISKIDCWDRDQIPVFTGIPYYSKNLAFNVGVGIMQDSFLPYHL